jgi:predicted dehydrogenase
MAALRGEREVACSGEDGREAVRLVLRAYESAALGRPVALADGVPAATP